MTKTAPRGIWGVLVPRGLSPCVRFAAVDTAVGPAGSRTLEALDVWAERNARIRKLKEGRDAPWRLWCTILRRICLYACWVRAVGLELLGLSSCLELSRAGLPVTPERSIFSVLPSLSEEMQFIFTRIRLLTVLTPVRIIVSMFYMWSPAFQVNKLWSAGYGMFWWTPRCGTEHWGMSGGRSTNLAKSTSRFLGPCIK